MDVLFGYDANLMFLFSEYPLEERPERAAACGFQAVELWWPFEGPNPPDRDVERLARRLTDAGTQLVALNFYAGDRAAGDRGALSVPGAEPACRASLEPMVALGAATGCSTFNALYGNRSANWEATRQDDLAIENLLMANEALRGLGATIVIEALNPPENPSYAITTVEAALSVRERAIDAGAPDVALLVDLYHYARCGVEPPAVLAEARSATCRSPTCLTATNRGRAASASTV